VKIYATQHRPTDKWEPIWILKYYLNKDDADAEIKALNQVLANQEALEYGCYEVEELEVLEKREGEIK
jgi:hypothetical protein